MKSRRDSSKEMKVRQKGNKYNGNPFITSCVLSKQSFVGTFLCFNLVLIFCCVGLAGVRAGGTSLMCVGAAGKGKAPLCPFYFCFSPYFVIFVLIALIFLTLISG